MSDHFLSTDLLVTRSVIASALHWPDNLGIQLRTMRLATCPETDILIVFITGVASEALVHEWVIAPLLRAPRQHPGPGPLTPEAARHLLPAPRLRPVQHLDAAVHGVLEGATALFFAGSAGGLLVGTEPPIAFPPGARGKSPDAFQPRLAANLAAIRHRVRDPNLVARAVDSPPGEASLAALVYLEGRADPRVVREAQRWLRRHAREGAMRQGMAAGLPSRWGLLPDVITTPWPDTVAALISAGYVAMLVDQVPRGHIAPVTLPAMLFNQGDTRLHQPVAAAARFARVLLGTLVLLGPALALALKEYHQEMIFTPFLLGLAATRETAALPVVGEVLGVEALQEVLREASFRLPVRVTAGESVIVATILALLLILTGIMGPVVPIMSLVVVLASLGLPNEDLAYMVRLWRWPMILAAAFFGLYGMSALCLALATYLAQARSFGVPWAGETGVRFHAPGRTSSRVRGAGPRAQRRILR